MVITEDQLDTLAERFCSTPLPASVSSDICTTDPNYTATRYGTNLLTVAEAKEVLRTMLKDPF